jgi:hypothetical protein
MKHRIQFAASVSLLLVLGHPASAQTGGALRADSHAPIAIMGDHYHEAGEVMLSYRFMTMSMFGNADGSASLAPETIATTVPNRFFGTPGQPPTLRVVPTKMTMDMHMFGIMYAPSDRITLMAMLNHITKDMEHTTFMGAAGTTVLGSFRTENSGVGDTSVAALIRLYEDDDSRLHLTAGLSLPTGDIEATGEVLAPTGMRPILRLPYSMQLGSGTYDLIAGLTYSQFARQWSWGAQWRSLLRTGDNDEGYSLGDEHRLNAWYSRLLSANVSWSTRLEWFDRGNIDGIDPLIVAPVQTADPSYQAAMGVDAAFGINYVREGGHRVAFEIVVPLHQDVDGPQLETDWQLTAGYQHSF